LNLINFIEKNPNTYGIKQVFYKNVLHDASIIQIQCHKYWYLFLINSVKYRMFDLRWLYKLIYFRIERKYLSFSFYPECGAKQKRNRTIMYLPLHKGNLGIPNSVALDVLLQLACTASLPPISSQIAIQILMLSHLMLYNLCRNSNTFFERVAIYLLCPGILVFFGQLTGYSYILRSTLENAKSNLRNYCH